MKLKINEPCNESWNDMTKVDETFKFCSVCDKNIYDFAVMSKTEAFVTILTAENPVCGRIKKEQMQLTEEDFPALLHTLQQPRFRAKAFLVLALVCSQLLSSCENNKTDSSKHTESTKQEKTGAKRNQDDNLTLGKVVKPNASNAEKEMNSKGANNKFKFVPPPIIQKGNEEVVGFIAPDPHDNWYQEKNNLSTIGFSDDNVNLGVPDNYPVNSEAPPSSTDILSYAEVMPEFPGGTTAMMEFLKKNLRYPDYAKELGIEGNVFVSFVVHSDGSLSDFVVLKSPDKTLSAEALRVVKSMPNWIPGENQGKKVNVKTTIPIRFRLTN